MILSISGVKARKLLNQDLRERFCRFLEPRPESHEIRTSGIDFHDFWSQGQKVIKSRPLASQPASLPASQRASQPARQPAEGIQQEKSMNPLRNSLIFLAVFLLLVKT